MSNQITTPVTQPATITKKELWALFIGMTINRRRRVGPVECCVELGDTYMPGTRIVSYSDYCELEYLSQSLLDEMVHDDDPLWKVEGTIDDLEAYLVDLKRIRDDFRRLATTLVVYPEDDDGDKDEYRYRDPVMASDNEREAA